MMLLQVRGSTKCGSTARYLEIPTLYDAGLPEMADGFLDLDH